jgi:hypothetical protein
MDALFVKVAGLDAHLKTIQRAVRRRRQLPHSCGLLGPDKSSVSKALTQSSPERNHTEGTGPQALSRKISAVKKP